MADLRPRNMTQAEFAAMLQREGFSACTKTAVSLAERSRETGVEFTTEARKVAQGLLNSARRAENRKNPNKTTVWLDDDMRIWLETEAWVDETCVGEVIRGLIREAMGRKEDVRPVNPFTLEPIEFGPTKKAAPDLVHPKRQE